MPCRSSPSTTAHWGTSWRCPRHITRPFSSRPRLLRQRPIKPRLRPSRNRNATRPNTLARRRSCRHGTRPKSTKRRPKPPRGERLAQAQARREVLEMRTELARRAAELRQQELVAEVVKPAEADAERVRILAVADAEQLKIQAEAAASHHRGALDRMLID